MKDTAGALYRFFSGFGLPAYVENNVPDNADLPYITYELREPQAGERSSLTARVWYIDTGFQAITEKVDEIKNAVADGASIPVDGGAVWLWADDNFCQFQPPDEPKLKIAYLMMIIGAYKM